MARVLSSRDFRLLISGAGASLLGDQFTLIATPWLVLTLTHDPFALGVVLALAGVPRAALMLFGGAISDRFSPRLIMLVVNVVRLVLVGAMAVVVAVGAIQLWMIFLSSVLFGTLAGLAVPAENSIVPRLVRTDDLQAGNSIMMGLTQLAGFVGPTLAGVLIGGFSDSTDGVSVAFAIDAVTFLVSAVTLWCIRAGEVSRGFRSQEGVLASASTGLRYLWTDRPLRLLFAMLLLVNVLLIGPLMVGIPVLADKRLPEGATAFGLLMSAFAIGNLIGYGAAGALPRPNGRQLHRILVTLIGAFGLVVGCLGFIPYTWLDFALLLLLGLGNGFMAIVLVTWMQARTEQSMHGRMMGVMMLASTGLNPVSQAVAGTLSSSSLVVLFAGPAAVVLLVAVWVTFHPTLRLLGAQMATCEAPVARTLTTAS